MIAWTARERLLVLSFAMTASLFAGHAAAFDRQDIADCDDDSNVPRMIEACTNLSLETRLPPKMRSMSLLKRGFGNFALNNFEGARADFSDAIELFPENNYAHHELGLTLVKLGDLAGAIAAMSEAIKLDPASAASRVSRCQMFAIDGKLDAAIEDCTEAIRLGADKNTAFIKDNEAERPEAARVQASYYSTRGHAFYLKGEFKKALQDLDVATHLAGSRLETQLSRAVFRMRAGSAGTAELEAAMAKHQSKDWPRPVAEMLLGRIAPPVALAAATNADQTCEAHYQIGMFHLGSKALALALKEFAIARDTCPKSIFEYRAAVTELDRMKP
jgi:tetratricopeptide (TPR) repeat protein